MAHFAKVEKGIVVQVIVAEQSHIDTLPRPIDGDWVQTSYNTFGGKTNSIVSEPLRKNFAGIGMIYDKDRDAFIPPRHNQFHVILDEKACHWECPYQARQTTDNNGRPLAYSDTSEYSVNADRNPKGWVWDDQKKTYKQVLAFEEQRVNYTYDNQQHMWVKQYF